MSLIKKQTLECKTFVFIKKSWSKTSELVGSFIEQTNTENCN